jgi:hypothetical protein
MAWLELAPSGFYHVAFRYGGRKLKRSLETDNPQLAEKALARVDENLRLVEQGRLDVPDGADLSEFVLYDGKLTFAKSNGSWSLPTTLGGASNGPSASSFDSLHPLVESKSLGAVLDEYYPEPDKRTFISETLRVARIHVTHLKRILGAETPISLLNRESLQDYVKRIAVALHFSLYSADDAGSARRDWWQLVVVPWRAD